jgi:hypothetical protein
VTLDKGHGRIERRTLRVSTALAGYSAFPGLAQVGELRTAVLNPRTGEYRETVRYLATSLTAAEASPNGSWRSAAVTGASRTGCTTSKTTASGKTATCSTAENGVWSGRYCVGSP